MVEIFEAKDTPQSANSSLIPQRSGHERTEGRGQVENDEQWNAPTEVVHLLG